jgi:hypothetical protein
MLMGALQLSPPSVLRTTPGSPPPAKITPPFLWKLK